MYVCVCVYDIMARCDYIFCNPIHRILPLYQTHTHIHTHIYIYKRMHMKTYTRAYLEPSFFMFAMMCLKHATFLSRHSDLFSSGRLCIHSIVTIQFYSYYADFWYRCLTRSLSSSDSCCRQGSEGHCDCPLVFLHPRLYELFLWRCPDRVVINNSI